jgi:NADH:ubiquinone oxidoreductase subunit 6 (subunit J)
MSFPSLVQSLLFFLSDDPALRLLQVVLLALSITIVFLVFWTVRDVLQRCDAFWQQLLWVVLVAFVPLVGFLLYVLLRPTTTRWQRRQTHLLRELLALQQKRSAKPDAVSPVAPPTPSKKLPSPSSKR